jgi:PDZ domain-containing protein
MEDRETRRSFWPLYLVGGLFAAAILAIVAWNIELPYLAFSSGPVSDAADAITTEEVEVFPPEGELLMLTVVSQDVNIFEALIAGVDPTIDLVRKEAIRRADESDEDYRRRVLEQMDDSQTRAITVAMSHLGFEMVPIQVLITDTVEGKPAAEKLDPGDTLNSVDGVSVSGAAQLREILAGRSVGDVVVLEVTRAGSLLTIEVELAPRDDDPEEPMLGVLVGEVTAPPFPVSIEAGNVGGPSAGMMHALAIIDILTPGEMTQGKVVAGTGTIQLDGTVGSIGGIRQKVVGAEAAGAEFILVPEGNYERALTAEFDTIEIVPVGHLDEAIDFLEALGAP